MVEKIVDWHQMEPPVRFRRKQKRPRQRQQAMHGNAIA
jgi:hypothetical protein